MTSNSSHLRSGKGRWEGQQLPLPEVGEGVECVCLRIAPTLPFLLRLRAFSPLEFFLGATLIGEEKNWHKFTLGSPIAEKDGTGFLTWE